jgi:antirestriction protein ArdC
MTKPNIHEIVTDRIISAMEQGIVPWRKPWTGHGGPVSLTTGRNYRGINNLILHMVQIADGYDLPLWGTYKQAQALGGSVRKGEKGTPIVLWKPIEKDKEDGSTESFMMMRYFTVFNVAQMDEVTVPDKFLIKREPVSVADGIQQVIAYPNGPTVRYLNQDQAFYTVKDDTITLPTLEQFVSPEAYSATVLHEIVHSTGHPSRMNRINDKNHWFGCEAYAQEELVAEIGSAMLATYLNLNVEWEQTASYIHNWLQRLRDDRKLLVQAAQQAQKAIDHIGIVEESMETTEVAA